MPQRPIDEQRFNQIVQRVIASAPEGLSEDQFNALIDQEVASAETAQDEFPAIGSPAFKADMAQRDTENSRGMREALPAIGGAIGSIYGGIPGAAAVGGLGASARNLLRANEGDPETPRTIGESLTSTGLNAAGQGALTAAGNVISAGVSRLGKAVTNRAVPMVRSAIKPVWAEMRRRAGIEGVLPSQVANKQAQFIVDRQLRTPEQADALVKQLGGQVDDEIAAAEQANPSLSIDSAARVPRYMNAVLRRIEKQMLPGQDRAAVQNVGRELVEDSPLSRQTTPQERSTLARERPQTETLPRSSRPRVLRDDVRPSQAAEMVRTRSFFDKDASGGTIAGGKAVERAVRDGLKEAVPATRAPLQAQGRAMDARQLLDRAAWRDSNRDSLGMGASMSLANLRPTMAAAMQLIKDRQLGMGLRAARWGPAIERSGAAVGTSSEQLARMVQELMQQQIRSQSQTGQPE